MTVACSGAGYFLRLHTLEPQALATHFAHRVVPTSYKTESGSPVLLWGGWGREVDTRVGVRAYWSDSESGSTCTEGSRPFH